MFGTSFATPNSAPATPLFGGAFSTPQPSAGAFGTPAPAAASTPAFSFGAATPAPASSSAASPWGAVTTPAPASVPAFGASAASATPKPLFGIAPGTSLFGTQPAATAAAAPASNAFSFSGFGTATQPAAATATTGALTAAHPQPFGTFGTTPQQAFPQAHPPFDAAVKEIGEIKAAYTPGSPMFRFQHLLLNVVDNPAQRVKPPAVDEMRWRQALAAAGGPDNPDRLWPVLASGTKDLLARSAAQVAAIDENTARLKALQDLAQKLAQRQGSEFKQRSTDIQKRHVDLSHRLLHVMRSLDGLEGRLASSVGYQAEAARDTQQRVARQLAAAEAELSPAAFTGLTRRVASLASAAQLGAQGGSVASSLQQVQLDPRSLSQLVSLLKEHGDGIARLQALLKRDAVDVTIMQQELGRDEDVAGNGGARRQVLLG